MLEAATTCVISANTPNGVRRSTSVTIRITITWATLMKWLKDAKMSGFLAAMPVAETPMKIENSTTAMVEVLRAPVMSRKGLAGMKLSTMLGSESAWAVGSLPCKYCAARQFGRARGQADRGQAEQLGHQDADQRGDHGGGHQGADGQHADLAERGSVLQLEDGGHDRHHDQRHDDHLQQLDVAGADDVEVGIGSRHHRRGRAVQRLERRAEQHAEAHAGEHALAERDVGGLHAVQREADGQGDGQVQDQWVIHVCPRVEGRGVPVQPGNESKHSIDIRAGLHQLQLALDAFVICYYIDQHEEGTAWGLVLPQNRF